MGLFNNNKKEKSLTKEEKKRIKDSEKELFEEFKKNSNLQIENLYFDDEKKQFLAKKKALQKQQIVDYQDVISYSEIINGKNVKKKHGVTRAVVGGVLAGPAGALVGATTGGKEFDVITKMVIIINLTGNKDLFVSILEGQWKKDSFVFKTSQQQFLKLKSKLDQIIFENNKAKKEPSNITDQIREYKQLLDEGILTQEEFDEKKKQLLNLDQPEDNK